MRILRKNLFIMGLSSIGLTAPLITGWGASFQVTYGLPGATSSSPQFTAVQNTTVPFVYYVKNISGSPISNLSFIPPINVPSTVVSAPSSCTSLTGALANNATCLLYLQLTVPPYVSGNTTYNVGPVTVCAGSSCSSSASTQNITLNVIQDGVAFVINNTANTISVYDTVTYGLLGTVSSASLGVGCTPEQSAMNPNGTFLYVPCSGTNRVAKVSTTSPFNVTLIATTPALNTPEGIAFTPDGQRYFVTNNGLNGSTTGATYVINANTDTFVTGMTGGLNGNPLNITSLNVPNGPGPTTNGLTAYVSYGAQGVNGWSLNPVTDSYVRISASTISTIGAFFLVPTTDSGQLWYADNGSNSTIGVIDTTTNTQLDTIGGFCNQTKAFVFNPSGFSTDPWGYEMCSNTTNHFIERIYFASGNPSNATSIYPTINSGSASGGPIYGSYTPYGKNELWAVNLGANASNGVTVINTQYWYTVTTLAAGGSGSWYVNFIP